MYVYVCMLCVFSYVLKVLELRALYSVRPSVRAPGSCPEASRTIVILARLSNISENDLRKTQYLSAGIVKTLSLLMTFFYEVS